MKTPSKHLPFFALVDALRQPGCALCRLVWTETRRYLDSLLYESVNDPGFRDAWRASGGFCHRHSWLLAESGDGLGLAILYLDLVQSWDEKLLIGSPGRRCRVCGVEKDSAYGHFRTLVEFWNDSEMQLALKQSDALCGPHLRMAMRLIRRKDIRQELVELSIQSLRKLAPDLRALIDSHDYRHAPATDPNLKFSWRRAIERIVGHRDVPEIA